MSWSRCALALCYGAAAAAANRRRTPAIPADDYERRRTSESTATATATTTPTPTSGSGNARRIESDPFVDNSVTFRRFADSLQQRRRQHVRCHQLLSFVIFLSVSLLFSSSVCLAGSAKLHILGSRAIKNIALGSGGAPSHRLHASGWNSLRREDCVCKKSGGQSPQPLNSWYGAR